MKHREIFGEAHWLSPRSSLDAALFRSDIEIKKQIKKAEITICGLGWFILYINGKRVGVDEFVPAYSDYHERPDLSLYYPLNDEWSHRIYVMKYDGAKYLHSGKNVVGIAVGGGYYHQTVRKAEGNMNYGEIKLCYKIDADGEVFYSNRKDVTCSPGFFKKSNLYFGETLDFSGFDRKWNTVDGTLADGEEPLEVVPPKSDFFVQDCPSDRVAETLVPEFVKDFGEYSVYKIERNVSGYPVVMCELAGETVVMECAENLNDDLTLNNMSVGFNEQRQMETFITDEGKIYQPFFCWFGFRFFTLTNNARPVEIRVIHSDIDVTSAFECSDETLNWYYRTFVNTQLSNMHSGVPSDCPHRERLGYTGDGQLTCNAVMTEFDAESFYRKWIADIWDCQDKTTGHVQHTAPFAGGGGGPAGWGGAIINVPYQFYRHYGHRNELEAMFSSMEKFVEYMESRTENGMIVREEKDGWCLGDWCTPTKIEIPEELVNTTMFISQLKRLIFCAKVLGRPYDKYESLITKYSRAVTEKYFDETTGDFFNNIQGANAFAVDCGLGDERTIENIVKKYSEKTEFDTGIFGTEILLNVLYKTGNGELATRLLANKGEVSFDFMRRAGATTLWENWNGEASHSHPMFGASTEFLFEEILGIKQGKETVRYDQITIAPAFPECLGFAKGKITTPHGEVAVSWKRCGNKIEICIDLCDGINASLVAFNKKMPLTVGKNEFVLNNPVT